MISLRNVVLLKIGAGLMSPRLLSGSVDKGDSKKGKDGKKKKEKKKDFCGKGKLISIRL